MSNGNLSDLSPKERDLVENDFFEMMRKLASNNDLDFYKTPKKPDGDQEIREPKGNIFLKRHKWNCCYIYFVIDKGVRQYGCGYWGHWERGAENWAKEIDNNFSIAKKEHEREGVRKNVDRRNGGLWIFKLMDIYETWNKEFFKDLRDFVEGKGNKIERIFEAKIKEMLDIVEKFEDKL
ncbi:MAG: hypothetical protein LBC59_02740 [Chitinispirillales bacterium]|jgi:hypothetical protein|nr:hypothetical protein [Chitinispirillales bacterium]